jgi:hypothetical protein
VYATYLGGSNFDNALGIAVDVAGNAYVTGSTQSTDFPTTTGAFQTTNAGGGDAFVTVLNSTASALVYSTYLGGSGFDDALSIAVDSLGNAYVTGATASTNFPTTSGASQTSNAGGGDDAFVTTLNATGSGLVYSSYLGGTGDDSGWGIRVNAPGNAFVTGSTSSTNFPTTTGAFQTAYGGGNADGFVANVGLFDFSIAATPSTNSVSPGGSVGYNVTTASIYPFGFPSNVTYSVSGLPSGATASFSANGQTVPGASTLAVTTASSTPAGNYTLTITGTGGIQTHSASVTLVVSYNICLLYDPTFAKKSGSTYPIKLQICDANGNNLSSSSIILQAQSVTRASNNAPGPLDDSGNANPDFDFRYDSTLAGYIFNLSLKGISTGTYNLNFTVSGDPVSHSASFQVK